MSPNSKMNELSLKCFAKIFSLNNYLPLCQELLSLWLFWYYKALALPCRLPLHNRMDTHLHALCTHTPSQNTVLLLLRFWPALPTNFAHPLFCPTLSADIRVACHHNMRKCISFSSLWCSRATFKRCTQYLMLIRHRPLQLLNRLLWLYALQSKNNNYVLWPTCCAGFLHFQSFYGMCVDAWLFSTESLHCCLTTPVLAHMWQGRWCRSRLKRKPLTVHTSSRATSSTT